MLIIKLSTCDGFLESYVEFQQLIIMNKFGYQTSVSRPNGHASFPPRPLPPRPLPPRQLSPGSLNITELHILMKITCKPEKNYYFKVNTNFYVQQ